MYHAHTQRHTHRHRGRMLIKSAYLLLGFVKERRQKCELSKKENFFDFEHLKSLTKALILTWLSSFSAEKLALPAGIG